MKVSIKGWIYRYQPSWLREPSFNFTSLHAEAKPADSEEAVYIFPHTIQVEVPDGDMIAERVAGIRAAKTKVYTAAHERVAELDEAEKNLLCLEAPTPTSSDQITSPRFTDDLRNFTDDIPF